MASKASAKTMRVLKTSDADFRADWLKVCNRRDDSVEDVEKDAKKIIDKARAEGNTVGESVFGVFDK